MSGRRNLSGRRCSTAVPRFDQLTPRAEEWDWPPTQRRYRTRFDVYQPSGWNSPGVKKAVHIYWQAMITIIKVLFAIPLSIMVIGGFWLLWIIITLPWRQT